MRCDCGLHGVVLCAGHRPGVCMCVQWRDYLHVLGGVSCNCSCIHGHGRSDADCGALASILQGLSLHSTPSAA